MRDAARRRWRDYLAVPDTETTKRFWSDVRRRHPSFMEAVRADASFNAATRGERFEHRSALDAALQACRLAVVSDAFLALCCYRAKAALQARRVPLLPRVLHRLAVVLGQVSIGDPVVIHPGVCFPHGQVVIDGPVEIHQKVVVFPFVTVGLREGVFDGPTLNERCHIGTGAKVLGPVTVGIGARVGANAVVLDDVADGAVVAGAPARPVLSGRA